MTTHVYKLECITNLHVGSGDVNYNIIDKEVERDPVTNNPMIHASGIKGALREHFEKKLDKSVIEKIFGRATTGMEITAGAYKFLDAHLISRPMRVEGSDVFASISVFTVDNLNRYLKLLTPLNCNPYGINEISAIDFSGKEFLCTESNISVEGESTGLLSDNIKNMLKPLENVLGTRYAIARSFDAYNLPVVARNCLENGISKNLWYEEYVPYTSVFFTLVMTPDDEEAQLPLDGAVVQFGGNASIGCGFTKLTKLV